MLINPRLTFRGDSLLSLKIKKPKEHANEYGLKLLLKNSKQRILLFILSAQTFLSKS